MPLTNTILLTEELILKHLNDYSDRALEKVSIFGTVLFFWILLGVLSQNIKDYLQPKTKKDISITITLTFSLFLVFPAFYSLYNHFNVEYAIKNNNYSVEIDYIEKTYSYCYEIKNTFYSDRFAVLKKHGKVSISDSLYFSLNTGDSVYVVIIKDLFKGTLVTVPIYPTEDYIYEN